MDIIKRGSNNFSKIDKEGVENYKKLWSDNDLTDNEKETIKIRKEQYMTLVNKYYDLATTFYGKKKNYRIKQKKNNSSFFLSFKIFFN